MEISKQSYSDVMRMPVYKMHEYLRWKQKFDEDVAKQREIDLENNK